MRNLAGRLERLEAASAWRDTLALTTEEESARHQAEAGLAGFVGLEWGVLEPARVLCWEPYLGG